MAEDNVTPAKLRWKFLSQNLLKLRHGGIITSDQKSSKISVRRFDNFGLFSVRQCDSESSNCNVSWCEYSVDIPLKIVETIKLKLSLYTTVHCQDLLGFNNTGNICIWPSEEVMAYYLLNDINGWTIGNNSMTVFEIGGGMTCFAGLVISAVLSRLGNSGGSVHEVVLTDGNERSCDNIRRIVAENESSCFDKTRVSVVTRQIIWGELAANDKYRQAVDLIICCDCFFFSEVHDDLLTTIDVLLKPHSGCAICFAPSRKGTFDLFKEKAKKLFDIEINMDYLNIVSDLNDTLTRSSESYSYDLHYPIQMILKRKD